MRSMITAAIDFARSWASRFLDVQGFDRAMALAASAFSAIVPLVIVSSALVPRDGKDFAQSIIDRFNLTGTAAATVTDAFATPEAVQSSVSVFGLLLVLIAALSF